MKVWFFHKHCRLPESKGVKIISTGYCVADSEIKNTMEHPQSSLQACSSKIDTE